VRGPSAKLLTFEYNGLRTYGVDQDESRGTIQRITGGRYGGNGTAPYECRLINPFLLVAQVIAAQAVPPQQQRQKAEKRCRA
jgi:hypothetical protein